MRLSERIRQIPAARGVAGQFSSGEGTMKFCFWFLGIVFVVSGCVGPEKLTGEEEQTAVEADSGTQDNGVLSEPDVVEVKSTGELPEKPDIGPITPDTVDGGSDAIVGTDAIDNDVDAGSDMDVEDSGPDGDSDATSEPDVPDVSGSDAEDIGSDADTVDAGSDANVGTDAVDNDVDVGPDMAVEDSGPDSGSDADSGPDVQVEPDVPVADATDAVDTADSGPDTTINDTGSPDVAVDSGPDMVDSGSSDVGTVDSGPDGSDAVDAGVDTQDVQPDVPAIDLCVSLNCNDGNPCTTDSCDPATGCKQVNDNGKICEDGTLCTSGETCSGGSCTAGAIKNCSDGNVCTADSCDPSKGCINAAMAGSCDDGNLCTDNDVCSAGVCMVGVAKTCDDGNGCTSNVCDAVTGCVNTPNYFVYDWKDGQVPANWTLTGNMEVACNLMNSFSGQKCVMKVSQGAPAFIESTGDLDLKTIRALKNMGDGDIRIAFKWARFQSEGNQDSMTSEVLDAADKKLASSSLSGSTGTVKTEEFVVGPLGVKLRYRLALGQMALKTGPAVWGTTTVAPVGCVPPQ